MKAEKKNTDWRKRVEALKTSMRRALKAAEEAAPGVGIFVLVMDERGAHGACYTTTMNPRVAIVTIEEALQRLKAQVDAQV